jgi:hypothetical protein
MMTMLAHPAPAQEVQTDPQVIYEDYHDTSPPLREIPSVELPASASRTIPWLRTNRPPMVMVAPDAVAQTYTASLVGTTNMFNFDGIGDRDLVAPPDTNGAVGATQFVETVNTSYQVFDKTSGASVFGPVEINTLWTGFGGLCDPSSLASQTDPVVLYDKLAGRWVIVEITYNSSFTSFSECLAVSTSSDATGSFNRYSIGFGSNLPDYDKLATWADAYYMTFNIFQNGSIFIGPQVCALNRSAMLAGTAMTAQCFQRSTSDASFLPSDFDGTMAPPTGEPNFYLELGSSTTLKLFKFHVDFTTPTNTTFTGPISIPVASYTDACGLTGTCIPQAGTSQRLDSLGDRLMHRLAYRNFGDHEALVATHSINSSSAVGVRWYEIRSPNATPVLFQQGTLAPSGVYLWMGSVAMDKLGDMAIGFSLSSGSLHPSIGYTGRVPTDPLNTLESPQLILKGSGSQTGGLSRWGDYSSMSVDPADDCTFWYSNEYLKSNGSFNWSTRIASFRFNSCP